MRNYYQQTITKEIDGKTESVTITLYVGKPMQFDKCQDYEVNKYFEAGDFSDEAKKRLSDYLADLSRDMADWYL